MALTKLQRDQVRSMYGGNCAYCGQMLGERWCADHLEPVHRGIGRDKSAMQKPERDTLENMMPACTACNISKGPMSLEVWRKWLVQHVQSLNRHHSIYRLSKAFGLVQETGAAVVFHFERIEREA